MTMKPNFMTKEMISIIPLWNFHLYVVTFQQHLYLEYISQLIRYSRACCSYQDFLDRGLMLIRKILNQGFPVVNLKSSLRKFYGRYHDLINNYWISVSQMTTDVIINKTKVLFTAGIGDFSWFWVSCLALWFYCS